MTLYELRKALNQISTNFNIKLDMWGSNHMLATKRKQQTLKGVIELTKQGHVNVSHDEVVVHRNVSFPGLHEAVRKTTASYLVQMEQQV